MISSSLWKSYYEDNLVLRVMTKDNRMFSQGKRLPNGASELLKRVQKVYVKGSTVSAVKLIRDEEFLSVHDSIKALNVLRGKESCSWTHLNN